MNPVYWGPAAWHFIHALAAAYPINPAESDKEIYKAFFDVLPFVLPCPVCGKHLKENLQTIPIRLGSRQELFEWTVDLHNEVNKQKGKKTYNYEEALAEFKSNSEFYKDFSLNKNGITFDTFAISDPKVKEVISKSAEQALLVKYEKEYKFKIGDYQTMKTQNKLFKGAFLILIVVGLVMYLRKK